jgi:hypothetical protein
MGSQWRINMLNLRKVVPIGVALALFAAGTLEMAKAQKAAANLKAPDPVVQGEDHVKALLRLVSDEDNTDKVTEQEFLRFITVESRGRALITRRPSVRAPIYRVLFRRLNICPPHSLNVGIEVGHTGRTQAV